MTGRVYKIEKGMVGLVLEDGQRCWSQPLGGYEIEVDDVTTGDLWSLGGEEFFNATRDYSMSVFIEGHT